MLCSDKKQYTKSAAWLTLSKQHKEEGEIMDQEIMSLDEWVKANTPRNGALSTEDFWRQIKFVRHYLSSAVVVSRSIPEIKRFRENIKAVGGQISGSKKLPVYQFTLGKVIFTMLGDSRSWIVSVDSPFEIAGEFMESFDLSEVLASECEGLPKELLYGSYEENSRRFTFEVQDEFVLYTFFWKFVRDLKESLELCQWVT